MTHGRPFEWNVYPIVPRPAGCALRARSRYWGEGSSDWNPNQIGGPRNGRKSAADNVENASPH